ncbi:MAG TPA: non-homologous end-joining DNA ligase [Streptosporangiaceae bacterium]|nr:non-homologous end-joining DNA ligase [Streptosporangiaceae bacterium]
MSGSNGKPAWFEPELATLTQDRFSNPAWIYERKLDGERCLAFRDGDQVRLMTRNRKMVSSTYPELVEALGAQQSGDFVVDGEVVAFSDGQTRFAELQQRMQQGRPSADLIRSVPVQYYLFDVLWADGTDLRPQPQRERKQRLHQLLDFADPLRFTEHRVGDGVEFYHEACRQGWEGLIAKRADAPYQAGRTKDWLKFKCENNQELVIGGFTDPQGTRTGLGALLLGYYDSDGQLVYAGKVGTGFSQQTLHRLHDELSAMEQDRSPFTRGDLPRERGAHWTEPRLVAQIGFSEWTTDGRLRHPRFQGLRRDKSPAEVIREVPQAHD